MDVNSDAVDILIVDDRLDGLIALEAVLNLPNVNLVRAQSGPEALGLLQQYDFAAVLLDVQMPGMDGFETARNVRKNEKYRTTPIIFVTAINKDDRHIYRGYEVGAVDYIFKPFEPQILRSKVFFFIDLYLKSRRLQQQADIIRENERHARYLQLAQLEMETLKRYRDLADAVPHMIWKAKIDGTLDYFNRGWTEFTGLSQEQSVGSGWQEAIHPDDLKQFLKTWIQSMTTAQPFEIECRVRREDGQMRWQWVRAVPETVLNQEVIAWIGTCTDIHDRKFAEQKLIEAQKAAVAANVAKTNFLANMSHEIRTPLSAILGFAEITLNPDLTPEERVQNINTICSSGRQLLRIIDEILDISKVEAGHLLVEKIDVDLLILLRELSKLLSIPAQTKGIELEFNLKSKIPRQITSDPTRLRQILTNMISNAIKFTSRGKVQVDVEWQAEAGGSSAKLKFHVTDTGVGIDPLDAEKLFQPFVQVDSSTTRRFGGTGLGLALARKLAQALGGNTSLDWSQRNRGSRFLIEIAGPPVEGAEFISSLDGREDKSIKFEQDAKSLSGVKVLLVEDAAINQVIIRRFLTEAGAQVDLAENGALGVKKALEGEYKVILMDIQMPEMDGYEATSTLRGQGYEKPIIALTAHALKEDRDQCLKVGCTGYLTKPVDRKTLLSQVAHFANV